MKSLSTALRRLLLRVKGRPIELDPRAYRERVPEIRRLESALSEAGDEAIRRRAREVRGVARASADDDPGDAEAFALASAAAQRFLGMRPFDSQIVAAAALRGGRLVELPTGEGKTLVAALAAAVIALRGGDPVHVLTCNDYLARRDARWMEPIYSALGVSVRSVQEGASADEKR